MCLISPPLNPHHSCWPCRGSSLALGSVLWWIRCLLVLPLLHMSYIPGLAWSAPSSLSTWGPFSGYLGHFWHWPCSSQPAVPAAWRQALWGGGWYRQCPPSPPAQCCAHQSLLLFCWSVVGRKRKAALSHTLFYLSSSAPLLNKVATTVLGVWQRPAGCSSSHVPYQQNGFIPPSPIWPLTGAKLPFLNVPAITCFCT